MLPHGHGTLDVDSALGDVARIYRNITGRDLPRNGAAAAPIPPEQDAQAVARTALEQLARQLEAVGPQLINNQIPVGAAAVDCWENGDWIHLYVDLPSVPASEVQLFLEGGMLVVRAHRKREVPGSARPTALERPAGLVERRIVLPPGIDSRQIQAELRDGVLHVKLRRQESTQEGQRIPVR